MPSMAVNGDHEVVYASGEDIRTCDNTRESCAAGREKSTRLKSSFDTEFTPISESKYISADAGEHTVVLVVPSMPPMIEP